MGAIAIILARAGSKGLPSKNTLLVAGKPCAMWTVETARAASAISRVVVSTDSLELQRLALEAGVDVVARPASLATDDARVDDAARHALQTVDESGVCDPVVILYGNVPVRPAGLLDRAIATLNKTGADSVQSYAPVGKFHPAWTCKIDAQSSRVIPWEGDTLWAGAHRRQDLAPAFIPDGGVIAVTRSALTWRPVDASAADVAGPHAFLGADHRAIINGAGDVVDIDSRVDLLVADAILRERADQAKGDHL